MPTTSIGSTMALVQNNLAISLYGAQCCTILRVSEITGSSSENTYRDRIECGNVSLDGCDRSDAMDYAAFLGRFTLEPS